MTNEMFDPEAAAVELRSIGQMSEGSRRARLAILQTAALVDIAASLRPIAAEAALAMTGPHGYFEEPTIEDPVTEGGDDETPDELELGEYVTPRDGELWGGILQPGIAYKIVSFGVTEGEPFVEVLDEGDGTVTRAWLAHVERADADEIIATSTEGEPIEIETSPVTDEEPEPRELAAAEDDLDNDFDGDSHEAAEDALARLAAAEKARKAGKTKKGGKKA